MKKLLLLLLIATEVLPVLARIDKEQSDRDSTIYKNVNLNEIEVISSPKSETRFFEFPGSISIIGEKKTGTTTYHVIKRSFVNSP